MVAGVSQPRRGAVRLAAADAPAGDGGADLVRLLLLASLPPAAAGAAREAPLLLHLLHLVIHRNVFFTETPKYISGKI